MIQKKTSADTLFSFLFLVLYLGLCFVSLWFSSGVVDNYLSTITSFSQSEGLCEDRPVISIVFIKGTSTVEKLQYNENIHIRYCPGYSSLWRSSQNNCKKLKPAEINEIPLDDKVNQTEEIFLEINKNDYRIIPQTKLFEERGNAIIRIYLNVGLEYNIFFYLTSLNNSLGHNFYKWNDGKQLQYQIVNNTRDPIVYIIEVRSLSTALSGVL